MIEQRQACINELFSIWLDWTNRHNMTKPVPSCWPNAHKAKHNAGPHVIHFQSFYFTTTSNCTPCENRMRILPKTKNKSSLNFQILHRHTIVVRLINHKLNVEIEEIKRVSIEKVRKWIKQGSSIEHGNFVWYNSSVCGTCIATDSMLYDNKSSQIHKCTLCFYFIYLD